MNSADSPNKMKCPVCHTANDASQYFCFFCGALLQPGRHDATSPIPEQEKQLKPQLRMGEFHFEGNKRLELMLSHTGVAIPVHLRNGQRVILGRRSKPTHLQTDAEDTKLQLTAEERAMLLAHAKQPQAEPPPKDKEEAVNTIDLTLFQGAQLGVSRRHALLMREDDRLHVRDLKSSNGTYLNNAPVSSQQRRLVRENDVLRLGNFRIVVLFQNVPPENSV